MARLGGIGKLNLRGATGEYRGVTGANGVVVSEFRADGAPEGAGEKLTASASTASVFPVVESASV